MNNNRTLLILSILFLFILKLTAQTPLILKGTVHDSLNQPLGFVNIYVQESDNAPIIAFSASNTEGGYELRLDKPIQHFLVKAAFIGYETQAIRVENSNTPLPLFHFKLSAKAFVLKETVIRANGKIIEKSDTTTFIADKFRDSTERNLEELLAKLPGVDIDKNTGVISVKGQPIKKILIEGDDLTGRNYQLMSKNLSADVVDKIQVIDKFNENKLLRGIRRSDDKVINITLKANRKNILFGNAIVGVGNDKRTNNSLNLFSFTKKMKSLTFGNFNTIGTKSDADRMVSNGFGEESESTRQHALINDDNNTLINIGRTPSLNIGSQSVRFNRTGLLSSHIIVRPTERLQVKGSVTFGNDRLQVFTDNEYRYQLRDSTFKLSETNAWTHRPEVWQSHFDVGFDVSEKATIRYQTDIQLARTMDISTTVANANRLDNQLKNNNLSWRNTLDFTRRLSDQKALLLNVTYIQNKVAQTYQLSQTQPRFLPPSVKTPFSSLNQTLDKPMQFAAVNGQFLFSKKQQKIAVSLGIVQKNQDFSSKLDLIDTTKQALLPSNDFKNDGRFQETNYYTSLNFKDQFGGVNFFSDISGGYFTLRYKDVFLDAKQKHGFYALPVVGFQKETEKNTLFGTYSYNIALPQIADIFGGYIVSDYRTIERGSSLFIPANSHTAILNATHGKFSDNFMCYLNIIGLTTQNGYRSDWGINTDFNTSKKVENTTQNRDLVLSSGLEYFSTLLSVRFKIRPTLSINWYQNTLNDNVLRNIRAATTAVDISMRSGYLGGFNYHLGTTWTLSQTQTAVSSNLISAVKNTSIGGFLDFYLKLSDKLTGKLENEMFRFKQSEAPPQYYGFVNSSLSYEAVRSRVYLTLTGRNLLNTKAFVNSSISDLSTRINRVQLLPRYILLEVNFRF
jgi:hypothetical protein